MPLPLFSLRSARLFAQQQARAFFLALGFLSRLAPAMSADTRAMNASVVWYPAAGAVLGAVMTLPFLTGLFAGQEWVRAWLYAALSAWLTRALHLDGLADVLDALGSGRRGEGFRAVLKDSRLGVFGVAGLFFVLVGQLVLGAACFRADRLAPLFFAPLFGRCLPIMLTFLAPFHPSASLGALMRGAPKKNAVSLAVSASLLGGILCLGGTSLLICLFLAACALLWLARIARCENGLNGDFFGCAVVAGEIAVLAAALL